MPLPCSAVLLCLSLPLPPAQESEQKPLTITPTQDVLYGPSAGEYLLSFSGNYRYVHASSAEPNADETEIFTARATFGLFFTREHEAGVELTPSYITSELGGSNFDVYLGAYYNYNIWTSPQANFYAGPQMGLFHSDATGSDAETAFSWGLHAGVRYWIDPRISLNVEPRISFTALDDDLGGDETVVDLLFGISFKL